MLEKCNKCGKEFLTEADPYVVLPFGKPYELNCGCFFKGRENTQQMIIKNIPEEVYRDKGLD